MPFLLLLILLSGRTSALQAPRMSQVFSQGVTPKSHAVSASADSILIEVTRKLNTLKRFEYEDTRELSYPSENYHKISSWKVFCDFEVFDTLTGFKYQSEDSTAKEIFNGAEKFRLDKKAMTIQINDHPDKSIFQQLPFLYNSIVTLRNILPLLISDPAVPRTAIDTTVDGIPCTQITMHLGKRRIQNLGHALDPMTTKYNFIYKVLIQKAGGLPYEIIQANDMNSDRITTTFTHLNPNPGSPDELSWYYSTYTNSYRREEKATTPQLIATGTHAPSWRLGSPISSNTISLDDLKGQVVLLDFWIKNCGHCIESVPHLNQLKEKFKDQPVKIISINAYDSNTDIEWFCNKHNIQYTVLSNGQAVAKEYGVDGFPTFIIIDKSGKVVYSNPGFGPSTRSTMEEMIAKAL